ncbi:MAG: hypothetical protein KF819_40285 [Labilithrix sp.]|nr:hypothetical protein [Labilithrix sp.]
MAAEVRVVRLDALPAAEIAALSRAALDRPLGGAAEVIVAVPADEAVVLGAFQRASELDEALNHTSTTRRGSGGAEARVGPGSVWMQLALARPDALVPCPPSRLLNRYVRPLLGAITKAGALARYFDRDWISARRSPVASVSFAHDTKSGRALVEAIVAVDTPFAVRDRPSFMGREPLSLRALGVARATGEVADAVIDAYASAYGPAERSREIPSHAGAIDLHREPPWAAIREEPIGVVGAGRDAEGVLRVGGELMVSRDVLADLERVIAESPHDPAAIERAIDALSGERVALLGIRSLQSIRDVIFEALELPRS